MPIEIRKKDKVLKRLIRNKLRTDIEEGKKHITDLFETDKELYYMRETFKPVKKKKIKFFLTNNKQ